MTKLRLVTVLAAVIALLSAPATALGQDNAAVAANDKDGSSLFDLAFAVEEVASSTVAPTNIAIAYATCESCQTVAIAIQIVLVASDPDVVTPQNIAIALNEQCELCQTFAAAYQFVIGGGGQQLEFTKRGWRELKRIRKAIARLGKQNLTLEELKARLDPLIAELREVLANELRPVEERGSREEEPDLEEEDTDTETTTEDTPPEQPPPAGTTETTPTQTEPTDTTSTQPPPATETAPPTDTTNTTP